VETAEQSTLGNSKTCSNKRLLFIRGELFAIKGVIHPRGSPIGLYISITRVLYFILVVSTVNSIVQRKLTDFLLFYFIFGCLVNFLHFMDLSHGNCVQTMVLLHV